MIEELLEPLVSGRFRNDERYRSGHVRIINALPGRRIVGVHIPDMVALAKTLVRRPDAMEIISGFESAACQEAESGRRDILSHEEMMVWGMMINSLERSCLSLPGADGIAGKGLDMSGLAGMRDARVRLLGLKLELLGQYVPHIDNWAVCDHVAGAAKWFGREVKRPLRSSPYGGTDSPAGKEGGTDDLICERLWKFLCGYFASDREFEVRFATVMAMSHFLDGKYLPRIFFRFDSLDFGRIRSEYVSSSNTQTPGRVIGEPPYYVRMGVAWCLATALAKFPDETRAYLRHSRLPENVVRLYVRKARESFRTRDISPF